MANRSSSRVRFTSGIIAAIGWVLWGLYAAVRAFGDAQAARDMLALINTVQINWGALYLILSVSATVVFVSLSTPGIKAAYLSFKKRNERSWNKSVIESINDIAKYSHFAKSITSHDKVSIAATSFVEEARAGHVRVAGRKPQSGQLKELPSNVWHQLYVKTTRAHGTGPLDSRDLSDIYLVQSENDKQPVYVGLMVDKKEIERVWPPNPSRVSRY